MPSSDDAAQLLEEVIAKARGAGADAADAVMMGGGSISVAYRLGELERLERSEGSDVGLRVFFGKRQAIASSSDTGPEALAELVDRACAMARAAPEDPHCGIADPDQVAASVPDLDIVSDDEPSPETLKEWARTCEEAARAVDGVTNSEGAEAGWGRTEVTLAASNGFTRGYAVSHYSLSASVLAGEGTAMETDYDFTAAIHASDLRTPQDVGRLAGERAVQRLGARKVGTASVPVVFDPRVSRGLLGHLASAVNGAAVARGTSFLKDHMDERIFAEGIVIIDDPHRPRGLASKPFDAEGIANRKKSIIEDGILRTWILDLRSARQLGLESTGNAARGTSSPPSPAMTNLHLEPGALSPKDLMADIKSGFYITSLMGMGVNPVTGDYSRGATGFWIENGALAYPVSEVTVAGNLKDMFLNLTPANDLEFRYGTNAPTVRIEGMTLAGT